MSEKFTIKLGTDIGTYDLIAIDETIVRTLRTEVAKAIEKLQQELASALGRYKTKQWTCEIERQRLVEQMQGIAERIDELKVPKKVIEYQRLTKDIMLSYHKLRANSGDLLLRELINNYLYIARRYVNVVQVGHMALPPQYCQGCGLDLDKSAKIEGIFALCSCGVEQEYMRSISDKSPRSDSGSGVYKNRDNFGNSFDLYINRAAVTLPEPLFKRLDEYFMGRGLPIGEAIRKMPVNKWGKKDGTSIPLLIQALQDLGESTYYRAIHPLAYRYWGWLVPPIGHLRKAVIDVYDQTQVYCKQFGNPGRSSGLNIPWRLCWTLWLCGHKCPPSDFKMVRTPELVEENEAIRRKVYGALGRTSEYLPLDAMEKLATC